MARWMLFVARRWTERKASRSSASSVLCVLEISAGVLALTVIIAVMNGFQLGYIESILEVSSYYIRVDNFPANRLSIADDIAKLPDVRACVPFKETEGIMMRPRGLRRQAVVLRGLPADVFSKDAGLKKHLVIETRIGTLPDDALLSSKHCILLGSELARTLGVIAGDTVTFLSISGLFSSETEQNTTFIVSGTFKSGYYQYDLSWGFLNLDAARALEENSGRITLGVKLRDRYDDRRALAEIKTLLDRAMGSESDVRLSSWRDYNKAFFGALRSEKLMMFVLVGLIFIVVALNIYQGQRRSVLERAEEIGLLRAVGATEAQVRAVFTFNGLLIGFIGATCGMALALLIATHIQGFFAAIEWIVTAFLHLVYRVSFGLWGQTSAFAIFNRQIFYFDGITARLLPTDVIIIYLFGLLSAVAAAWLASRRVAKINPAEVLRYE
jgi:lipoprotein-releasing system permease protein